jgi:hypothetical protein
MTKAQVFGLLLAALIAPSMGLAPAALGADSMATCKEQKTTPDMPDMPLMPKFDKKKPMPTPMASDGTMQGDVGAKAMAHDACADAILEQDQKLLDGKKK